METVDLSKPSLWTVCVLLLAPQQVSPKPRRNKTWTSSVAFFFLCFSSKLKTARKWSLCSIITPSWLFWKMFKPALKFYYFLGPFCLLDMIALKLNVRKGEIQSDPRKFFSLTSEENPPRLTIGHHWIGDWGLYTFTESQERGAIWQSTWLEGIIGLGHRWATDGRYMCISESRS